MLTSHVPLAWRNLVHDKKRFVVSIAGIMLAILLMFVELGFWNALLDAAVALVRSFNGELVIVSKARHTMAMNERFTTRRIEQARGVPGVQTVFPIYIEDRLALWKDLENTNPDEASSRPIRVLAFNPAFPALRFNDIDKLRELIALPDTVLIDRKSKDDYGKRAANLDRELARKSIRVVGTFELGTDFMSDGNLIMSDQTYAKLFPNRLAPGSTLALADVGVVQVVPGYSIGEVRDALLEVLPSDVTVYTLQEFVGKEMRFWQGATPVGFIFTVGLIMGVIVGMVICSQILSADVADHLKEYATLKAIGYTNRYLAWIVIQEGLLLSILGFIPSLAIALALYGYLEQLTGLPMFLTVGRAGAVLLMAMIMCLISGLIALRKVQKTDPAEVF